MRGLVLLAWALLLGAATLTRGATVSCPSFPELPQCTRVVRDSAFLIDASESIEPARFYADMLDYAKQLWCALHADIPNRGMLITFGRDVRVRIPFQTYTSAQWITAVTNLESDPTLCCACCTPTADALRVARAQLEANLINDGRQTFVALISDGDPWSAKDKTSGITYTFPAVNPAKYRFQIVPKEAQKLKTAIPKLDLLFVGVPNKHGEPPELGYMRGVPDASLYPKGVKSGNRQCIRRDGKRWCSRIQFPPFPIVTPAHAISAETWDISALVFETIGSLCDVLPPSRSPTAPTPAPTFGRDIPPTAPTKAPTAGPPTKRPTVRPTRDGVPFAGIDMYLFLDRSKSMVWRADVCRRAPGANPDADDAHVCWELFVRFAETAVRNATQMRYPDGEASPGFGWQGEHPLISQGVRVWMYGFACANQQSTPIVEIIGERINTQEAFDAAIARARALTPDGGTCPTAAVERALGQIMQYDYRTRPYKAAILVTDGVVYDDPSLAFQGLNKLGLMTWALGIGIPDNGKNFGLKPQEITQQRKQLLSFVDGDKSRRLNFGVEGLFVLDTIASDIIATLPEVVEGTKPLPEKGFYCGFTNNERCLNRDPSSFDTSRYCKWIPNNWDRFEGNGRCMDKTWCGWTRPGCQQDSFCRWTGSRCVAKAAT